MKKLSSDLVCLEMIEKVNEFAIFFSTFFKSFLKGPGKERIGCSKFGNFFCNPPVFIEIERFRTALTVTDLPKLLLRVSL